MLGRSSRRDFSTIENLAVPTTSGGDMLIVYLLPEGAFEFVK